jgi:hypothetical protein
MSAPLPLRFYNPVKDLCAKVNLDYETVIGTGLSPAMREAYVNADVAKTLDKIDGKDKKQIKHKVEFLNRKYGGTDSKGVVGEGETEDKGRVRYDMGARTESVLLDDSEVDKSSSSSTGLEDSKPFQYKRTGVVFIPGRGAIDRSEIGRMD